MKLKLMAFIVGLGLFLQAGECKIDYIGTLEKENILNYEVNGKSVIIKLDKGIAFRIVGYLSEDKDNGVKKAYIGSSKMCFNSNMQEECIEIDTSNNDDIINIFLEKTFCIEE